MRFVVKNVEQQLPLGGPWGLDLHMSSVGPIIIDGVEIHPDHEKFQMVMGLFINPKTLATVEVPSPGDQSRRQRKIGDALLDIGAMLIFKTPQEIVEEVRLTSCLDDVELPEIVDAYNSIFAEDDEDDD
jgi:hypothetical protein